ncbi:hypothetical protein EZS27_010878 [termite gut metagenome]|uniref:DNA methylase N-4/N-6 domain-containing protein n=1 Tax=termite gut metagenome TaxID=433724 RepID=A0A5J4S7L8_9ZZZZ
MSETNEEIKEKTIKNISQNQKEILFNIMKLHNNGKGFDCDMTYSTGNFYKENKTEDKFIIPNPKYKFDVEPQVEGVEKIELYGKLPLKDNSIGSIVIDLPFVIMPLYSQSALNVKNTEGNLLIFRRFGGYNSPNDLFKSYYHWIEEAYRVLNDGGICVFKTQANICSSKNYFTPEYAWVVAQEIGFYALDQFFLEAKVRLISGKVKKQQHARKYTSTFWVFKKSKLKKWTTINYFNWKNDNFAV